MVYSDNDFQSLYNTLKSSLLQKTNFNIDSQRKYHDTLKTIVKNVLVNNKNQSSMYVNSLLMDIVVKKFTTDIMNDKHKSVNNQPNPVPINISPRPLGSPLARNSSKGAMSKEDIEKQFNMNSVEECGKIDLVSKMEQYRMERGMSNAPVQVPVPVVVPVQVPVQVPVAEAATDNDFFRSLYENKIAESNPFASQNTPPPKPPQPQLPPPVKMSIRDHSEENQLNEYNSSIEHLKEEQKLTKDIKESSSELYQNTNFNYERELGKLIVIDTDELVGAVTNISLNLVESVVIDKQCDVFLEFLTLQQITNLKNYNLLALKIDQLPVNIGTTNKELLNQYVFPNETFGDGGEDAGDADSYNIRLKSNYMTTVTPGKYSTFNITLSGLDGSTIAPLSIASGGRITIGLFFKKRS
jgi:hypothetical protein